MEYLLNSEEMRSCDRRTEEVFKMLISIVLMERAALSSWRLFWIWQTGLMRPRPGTVRKRQQWRWICHCQNFKRAGS